MKMYDIVFGIYVLVILPLVSFIYFAMAITDFPYFFMILGAIALWGVMIPYPLYKYIKMKFIT